MLASGGGDGEGVDSGISTTPGNDRRVDAMEENPRDRQADPDDEAEQTHHVNERQAADPFFPEFLEIGHEPDREKSHDEEQFAKYVALSGRGLEHANAATP